jgi:proteasome lid subunit RPN8/RPN11
VQLLFRPVGELVVPRRLVRTVDEHVEAEHPHEAGGFLRHERRDGTLRAVGHIPLTNEATEPRRRFAATIGETASRPPRVFYHPHTSARSPSGLTRLDERSITEPFALVAFAPHGDVYSYRAFAPRLLHWQELDVLAATEATPNRCVDVEPLPQLQRSTGVVVRALIRPHTTTTSTDGTRSWGPFDTRGRTYPVTKQSCGKTF